MQRGEAMTAMIVDSTVSLRAGAKHLEVETVVHNNARDHRLRVLFPSGTNAQTYLADSPFDVVERKIALRADNHLYREPEIDAKPQQSFSAVFEAGRGLGVVSSGLLESALLDLAEKPLALTLFRATRQTVNTNGEPEGQMQGELRFRYWISPISAGVDRAGLARLGHALSGGFYSAQLRGLDVRLNRQEKRLPAQASYLRLGGAVVLTSLRRTSAGLEARVFNPNPDPVEAVFDLSGWPEGAEIPLSAAPVNLESQPAGEAKPLKAGKVTFGLGSKQILTVCFK
jgi:alpha-mannosidase/mannosylglycerate hydrolase